MLLPEVYTKFSFKFKQKYSVVTKRMEYPKDEFYDVIQGTTIMAKDLENAYRIVKDVFGFSRHKVALVDSVEVELFKPIISTLKDIKVIGDENNSLYLEESLEIE